MADNVISKIKLPDNQEYILKDSDAARSNHTHDTSLAEAAASVTSELTLKSNTKYTLTAGGESYSFTTPVDNDSKVTQTATTTSANYEVLFSGTADNTNHTEGARKTSTLTYNPSTKDLSTGGKINGYTLAAASARSVDSEIGAASTSTNLPTSKAVATFVEGKGYVTSSGVTQVGTGAGLTGGTITGTGTIKANLTSETKLDNAAVDGTETAGRVYPVRLDKDGKLAVNVPWINTNGNYLTGVTTTGSGNAITAVEKNGQSLTFTKGTTFLTAHRTYTQFTGNPTSNQTPAFGSTFTVQQISQATTGQVSGTDRTVTIPGTIAANNTKGLIKPWYNHTKASTGPTAGSDATAVAVNAISNTAGKYYAVEIDSDGRLFANVPWTDTNTHHQAKLIVGATSTATANAAVTANSIYANVIENSSVRSSNNIVGGGSVAVSSDANGKITITGTKSGTVTSITPGNGLLNGTGTSAITTSGTLNINYGTSVSNVSGSGSLVGTANTVSRSDHTHKIEIDEGTNNGEISIAGVTVKPKGIAALAYKASLVAGDIPNLPWSKITSGKPTTLSGYGITDAKIDAGVITLGSNTIKPVTSVNGHTGSSVNVTAGDLGLSSALRYIGKTTSTMSESFTGVPAGISGYTKPIVGDVVLDSAGNGEYVCIAVSGTTYIWESLGSESSFKKVQTAVSSPSAGNSAQIEFINTISQDEQGVISATKQPVRVASKTQTGVIQITKDNANLFLNTLDTGSSTPTDDDYYISQYVGGGTTTTTYHRRPVSKLYDYIKSKTDTLYPTKAGGGATGTWDIGISGNAATATKFASAQSVTLTGDASGTASSQAGWSISTVNKYITGRGRLESANIENTSYLSKFFTFLASSSMTEGKPAVDGSIAYFGWDNNGWAGELYVPSAKNGQLQFRGASNNSGASDWEDWVTVLDTRNYTTTLDSTYVKKTAGVTAVTWDGTNNKLTRTINGTTSDVVTLATIKTALGTMTPSSHAHGNIANGGTITSTAVALANGDNLLFADSSNSGKIERSSITIGTATNTWLCNNGTWTAPTAAQVGAVALANGVTAVTWDSTNKKITRTINGTAADVVAFEGTSPITVTGAANKLTIAHNGNSGYKHIPSGGSSGQFLGWDSDGTAKWVANPNSDTKVTSVGNHYTPAADTNSQLSASASGATAAWSIDVVKAVQLQRDAKGHVTGVTVTSGKIPANPNTDTKVNVTARGTTKAYLLATSTSPTTSAQGVTALAETGVYLDTAGELVATKFTGVLNGTANIANKLGTADKGSATKPIYLADGVATECSTYAGGTAVTLNGASKAASTASFYAPTSAGSNTQILVGGTPSWVYPGISIGAGTSSAAPTIGFTTSTSSISAQSITIASTAVYGVTKLQDGVSSDSTVLAATAKAAKTASTSATHTLTTTTKFFVTGCTSSTTNTAGDDFDTGVYVTTTAGEFSAVRHSYNVAGAERAYTHYNMTDQSIDFVFV